MRRHKVAVRVRAMMGVLVCLGSVRIMMVVRLTGSRLGLSMRVDRSTMRQERRVYLATSAMINHDMRGGTQESKERQDTDDALHAQNLSSVQPCKGTLRQRTFPGVEQYHQTHRKPCTTSLMRK